MSMELEALVLEVHAAYECPACGGWTYDATTCKRPCPANPSTMVSLSPAQRALLRFLDGQCEVFTNRSSPGNTARIKEKLRFKQLLDADDKPTKLGHVIAGRTR